MNKSGWRAGEETTPTFQDHLDIFWLINKFSDHENCARVYVKFNSRQKKGREREDKDCLWDKEGEFLLNAKEKEVSCCHFH